MNLSSDLLASALRSTAGTYATFGAAAPARIGLTLAKAARKTGILTAEFAASLAPLVCRATTKGRSPGRR